MAANFRTTRGSIEYELLPNYTERFTSKGQQEIIHYVKLPWDKKDAFITAVMPDVSTGGVITNGKFTLTPFAPADRYDVRVERREINRLLPQVHPTRSKFYVEGVVLVQGGGYPSAVAGDMAFKTGQGVDAKTGVAILEVTYRTLPYDATQADSVANLATATELGRYVSRKSTPSHKNLALPGRRIVLYDEFNNLMATRVNDSTTKTFSWQHLVYTWHMVPGVPRAATLYGGMVNSYTFDEEDTVFLKGTGLPGTILYVGGNVSEPYTTISGTRVWDISYNFLHFYNIAIYNTQGGIRPANAIGHNHIFSPQFNKFGRAWLPQLPTETGMAAAWLWPAGIVRELAAGRPGFADKGFAGRNIYDYVDLENLFRLDV